MSPVLPWHQATFEALGAVAETGRLGHALLLQGPAGWGKRVFARQFARHLLGIAAPDAAAVRPGDEASDQDLLAHPDARIVARSAAPTTGRLRTQITVDQIRALGEFLARTSSSGGRRVVIVELAEDLNVNAANALLKSLEEPGRDTHLLLVSHEPSRTLATIRSRCQARTLPPGASSDVHDWLAGRVPAGADTERLLALAGGAPLLALELLEEDALPLADEVDAFLARGDLGALIDAPGRLDTDQQRARAQRIVTFLYRALAYRIRTAAATGVRPSDQRALDRVLAARRALASTANPNVALLLEDLLLPLRRLDPGP